MELFARIGIVRNKTGFPVNIKMKSEKFRKTICCIKRRKILCKKVKRYSGTHYDFSTAV